MCRWEVWKKKRGGVEIYFESVDSGAVFVEGVHEMHSKLFFF
jgi:hypothetical protein